MLDRKPFDTLSRSLLALRAAGEHGPQSLSAMRSAGNAALIVLIEREMGRMTEEVASTDPVTEAMGRAQEKAHEEEE